MSSPALIIPEFQQMKTIKAHSDNINSLAFSEDGKLLASGGDDGYLRIFATQNWKEFRSYRVASPIRAVTWQPGNMIIAGLKNGIVNTIQVKVERTLVIMSHLKAWI